MKYLYSIIIPHKNSVDVLKRCLDSIPVRDDTQIFVIDDNSDSFVVDFDHFPGLDRNDVTIIFDKSGKGAGHARNLGLDRVDSKWVLFSDSDDFFTERLSEILDKYKDSLNEILHFDVESVYSDTLEPCDRSSNYKGKFYKAIDTNNIDILRYKMNTPWGKMVSFNLIKKYEIRFDELPVANDAMFSLKVGFHANNISAIKIPLYVVTAGRPSLTEQRTSENLWTRFGVAVEINNFLSKNSLEKYHINLFAYLYFFSKTGINDIRKCIMKSVKYTPKKYIVPDLLTCFKTLLSKTR